MDGRSVAGSRQALLCSPQPDSGTQAPRGMPRTPSSWPPKHGPRTSRILSWEPVRNAEYRAPPQTHRTTIFVLRRFTGAAQACGPTSSTSLVKPLGEALRHSTKSRLSGRTGSGKHPQRSRQCVASILATCGGRAEG